MFGEGKSGVKAQLGSVYEITPIFVRRLPLRARSSQWSDEAAQVGALGNPGGNTVSSPHSSRGGKRCCCSLRGIMICRALISPAVSGSSQTH